MELTIFITEEETSELKAIVAETIHNEKQREKIN